MPSCFAACVPSNFGLFLFLLARSLLLVCGAGVVGVLVPAELPPPPSPGSQIEESRTGGRITDQGYEQHWEGMEQCTS